MYIHFEFKKHVWTDKYEQKHYVFMRAYIKYIYKY